jgi:pentatricopeptide repeat protein
MGLGYGREIHGQVVKLGFESNVFVGIALVDMYAKCGRVDVARQMFYLMPVRNIVSWTAMVAGYAQNGQVDEATRFFNQIHQTDMKPNELTFVSVVNACVIHIDL